MLHIDGPYSSAFDAFIVFSSVVTFITFIVNAKTIKKDYLLASRNMIALVSFFPFLIAAVVLIMLSNTTNPVPVIVIIPTVSLYIVLVFYYISKIKIFDLSIGPKAFWERLKVVYLFMCHLDTKKELDYANKRLQLLIYKEAMQRHNNNFNAAADELKMHPTTLRNALKEEGGNA